MNLDFGIAEYRTILIGIVFFLLLLYLNSGKKYNWPKGPTGLPILGNLLLFFKLNNAESMSDEITKLSKKYGNFVRLKLAHKNIVFISGKEAIKEGWQQKGDVFSGRPNFWPITQYLSKGKGLIMSTDVAEYRQIRKHITAALRDFGVGKKSIESKIQHEARELAMQFTEQNGKVFEMEMISTKAVANVIAAVLFGERFEYHDKDFTQLLSYLLEYFTHYGTPIIPYILLPVPIARLLSPSINIAIKCHDGMKNFMFKKIEEHRKTYDPNNIRDICDVVIEGKLSPVVGDNIIQTMVDLFLAGTETTSTTLQWTCLLMIRNPEVQEKCHREIVEVIGEREATLDDKKNMPYNVAVFNEVSRLGSVLPMAVLRETLSDVEIGGYSLPKGTLVAPNLNEMHHHPDDWPEPNLFNPDRWLTVDEDGTPCLIHMPDCFMPFNIGPRKCVGEVLSRSEMFLMLIAILQRHKLISETEDRMPQLNIKEMVTRHPHSFKLRAVSW